MLRKPSLYSILLAVFVLIPVLQGSQCLADQITAVMRAADPRLERRVTIADQKIYLAKLMEDLSAQTGVALTISNRDQASGERVAISVHALPLADVLNALWSVFSYRGDSWQYVRAGGKDGEALSYELGPPRSEEQWAARIRGQIHEDLTTQAKTMIAGLKLSPEQVADAPIDSITKTYLADSTIRSGVAAFATLTTDQQNELLQGSTMPLLVTPSDPSTPSAAALQFLINQHNQHGTQLVGDQVPKTLLFSTNQSPGGLCTNIFLEIYGLGGPGILGGDPFEAHWQAKIANLWMNEGDAKKDDIEGKIVAEPVPALTPEETARQEKALKKLHSAEVTARRVQQAADADSIPFVMRFPWVPPNVGESTPDPVYGKPLAKLFSRMDDFKYHHKWRGRILLITRFTWINADDGNEMRLPYSTLKRLWNFRDNPHPTLEDMVFLASALTASQLETLRQEIRKLDSVSLSRFLLLDLAKGPDDLILALRLPDGVPLIDLPPALVRDLRIDRQYDGAVQLRETEGHQKDPRDPRIYHFYCFFGLPAADTSGRKPEMRSFITYFTPEPIPGQ